MPLVKIGAITIATKNSSKMTTEELELEQAFREAADIPEAAITSTGYQGYKAKKKAAKAAKKAKAPKKSRMSTGVKVLIALCVTLVILAGVAFGGYKYYMYITTDDGLVFANVKIDGINLGGKTPAEAKALLENELVNKYLQDIVITLPDGELRITPEDTEVSFDLDAIVKDAYEYGRQGTRYEQYKARNAAALTSHHLELKDYMAINLPKIREALSSVDSKYNIPLIQPSAVLVGERPTLADDKETPQTLKITMGQIGVQMDTTELFTEVVEAFYKSEFQLKPEVVYTEPGALDLQPIYDATFALPVDAAYALVDGECIVTAESYGYQFDLAAAQAFVAQATHNETTEIPFTYTAPTVFSAHLKDVLFDDTLAMIDTYQPVSTDNRNVNLALASAAIHGTIVMPGEVFSYNDCLGKRTAEKGYKPADAYSGGDIVQSVGGGVCQGATAIYYGALFADLEIVERRNHTYDSSYVPLGMDATVSWGSIDFKFRNNTGYPIRLGSYAYNGGVCIWISGTDTKDYYIEMEYEILEEKEPPIKYLELPYDNEDGWKDGDIYSSGHKAYKIQTYKCKYDSKTGALISRTKEAYSSYKAATRTVIKIDPDTIPEETLPPETTVPETTVPETTNP